MIKRLRGPHSEEMLNAIYSSPHDHRIYGRGHDVRVETTKVLAKNMSILVRANSGADLSCGNGDILNSLPVSTKYLGDFAGNYQFSGPLEENLAKIKNVDIYICSETLEHLDSPIDALRQIRSKSKSIGLEVKFQLGKTFRRQSLVEKYFPFSLFLFQDFFC